MAHKKGQGATRNGRDSHSKRRGLKQFGGQVVRKGAILVRQCGTKFHPGKNVRRAKDDTLYAIADGIVHFESRKRVSVYAADN